MKIFILLLALTTIGLAQSQVAFVLLSDEPEGQGSMRCGGTLIHSDIVLTAAGCAPEGTYARVGYLNDSVAVGGVQVVGKTVPHPDFGGVQENCNGDLMIIKLDTPIQMGDTDALVPLNRISAVPSDNREVVVSVEAGSLEDANGDFSAGTKDTPATEYFDERVSGELETLPFQRECNQPFVDSKPGYVSSLEEAKQFCAKGAQPCDNGGRGSPLYGVDAAVDSYQVGIASQGSCGAEFGFVYTRVAYYIDWIEQQVCDLSDDPPASCQETAAPETAAPETAAPEPTPSPVVPPPALNLVETAQSDPTFGVLVALLSQTGLVDALSDPSVQYTVFAPTNDAFEDAFNLFVDDLEQALEGTELLTSVLLYHVVEGAIPSSALSDGMKVTTLNGKEMEISISGGGVSINDSANVIIADIITANGIIHVIDALLVPPSAAPPSQTITELALGAPFLSTLVTLVTSAGQEAILDALMGEGPLTVFAPTDDAFAAIDTSSATAADISNILLYHVVSGSALSTDLVDGAVFALNGDPIIVNPSDTGVTLNGDVSVTTADLLGSNGVVHIIDKVLAPPTSTIEEIAVSDANFASLVFMLELANLIGFFNDPESQYTVFAPTNNAFLKAQEQLGIDVNEILGSEEAVEQMTAFLTYHVVAGVIPSNALSDGMSVTTLSGENVEISVGDAGVVLNGDSTVSVADILAKNGIIHVIDCVLVPPEMI